MISVERLRQFATKWRQWHPNRPAQVCTGICMGGRAAVASLMCALLFATAAMACSTATCYL
jgi:hypothetical protein